MKNNALSLILKKSSELKSLSTEELSQVSGGVKSSPESADIHVKELNSSENSFGDWSGNAYRYSF